MNILTSLVPLIIASLQRVLRQTGSVLNAAVTDASADAAAVGQTVNLPGSASQSAYTIQPASTVPALVGIEPVASTLEITEYKGSRFHLTGEDMRAIGARGTELILRQVDECIATLVEGMAAFLWQKHDVGAGLAIGAAGTDPFATTPNILLDAWRRQTDLSVPAMGRLAILSTMEWASAGKLPQFQKLNEAPAGTVFANAQLGTLASYMAQYDQAIARHTAGTGAGFTVDGAALAGATVITLDDGTGTILPGDVVHFGADTVNKYVVGVSAIVGDAGTVTLNSPLVEEVPDDATVTVAASHRSSLLVHPEAAVMAIRPPAEAPGGDAAVDVTMIRDPVTGVTLRLGRYPVYHASQWELSVVYGAAMRRPNLSMKLIA